MIQSGGSERTGLGAATENDNGIGFCRRVVDHPGIGQTREQRGAKDIADQEKDAADAEGPGEAARPAARIGYGKKHESKVEIEKAENRNRPNQSKK